MAKVAQTKDKDFDAIEPRVTFQDMPEDRFNKIVQVCRDAYSKWNYDIFKGISGSLCWFQWESRWFWLSWGLTVFIIWM